jgi:hypothetical protein
VSDVVESERVDESDSTLRFHRVDGWLIVEVDGEVAEVGWSPKRHQKGVLLVGEVLSEQVVRTVESVDHTLNVLKIVARNLTGVEVCSFVAPDDVTLRELQVGQCDVEI